MSPDRRQIEEALRYMRVPPHAYDQLKNLAEQGFANLSAVARPRKVWRKFALRVEENRVFAGGELLCESAHLSRLFAQCRYGVALAVTLGPEVDRLIQRLARNDVSSAVACDACASVWADSLCDEIERELEATLTAGEFLTLRFSPGYGDVPMAVTADIFRLVDATRRIGVTLSLKGMMVPVKSVTALIGIADRPQRRRRSCDMCAMKNCDYRKDGGLCHAETV